jgi:hypothetical protein
MAGIFLKTMPWVQLQEGTKYLRIKQTVAVISVRGLLIQSVIASSRTVKVKISKHNIGD